MAIRVEQQAPEEGDPRALDTRAANNRIAEKAEKLNFVSRVPMLCECGAPECRTIVMVSFEEYRGIRETPDAFLTAPGHQLDGARLHEQTEEYAVWVNRGHREGNGDRRCA